MEKLLNHCDKECMRMAMLKHEETFREQVYELHRLYQIQKLLMKEITKTPTNHRRTRNSIQPELQKFSVLESGTTDKRGFTTEIDDDDDDHHNNDLELTLGPKIYNKKKKKIIVNDDACEHAIDQSDSGPSFSSSSTGSCHVIKGRRNTRRDHHWPSLEIMPVVSNNNNNNNGKNNQDRLNSSPPWIFQALSLNMT